MKYDDNFIYKYYGPFLSSKNHQDLSFGSEYDSVKRKVRRKENILDYY